MKSIWASILKVLKRGDFWLHAGACGIVAVFVSMILVHVSAGNGLPAVLGGGMAGFFCGLGKEYGDSRSPGNRWSWLDILGDIVGSAIGCQIGWAALLI